MKFKMKIGETNQHYWPSSGGAYSLLRGVCCLGLLAVSLVIAGHSICFGIEPLPTGWWHVEAGEVLKRAEFVTSNVDFMISSAVRSKADPKMGFEYYQRRTTGGDVESKTVVKRSGRILCITYNLASGRYYDADGLLRKIDFEEGPDIEIRCASSIANPYEYSLLKSDFAGTNDCVVIRRVMSKALLDAVAAEIHKDKTAQELALLAQKNIRAVRDYYIRKSDGVIAGYLNWNLSGGKLLDDSLADSLTIGLPITDDEFALREQRVAVTVSNFAQAKEIMVSRAADKAGLTPVNAGQTWKKRRIVILIFGASILTGAALLFKARRNSEVR